MRFAKSETSWTKAWLAGGVIAAGFASAALAQTPVQPQPTDPNMPSRQSVPPDKIAPDATTGTLSDKLNSTDGVIKPPAGSTPDMRVVPPAPNAGTMPIIKPNETTGGAQAK